MIKKPNRSGILEYYQDHQPKTRGLSRKEKLEQIDLNSFCTKLWPVESKMMWHVVNESGAGGSKQYGAQLNKMGRKSGVPDWPVMLPSGGYHGLYVELKRAHKVDSSTSKEQKAFMIAAQDLGYKCVIAYGYQAAIEAIKDYFAKGID